jgi:spore maturation protein CgeB
MSFRFQRIAADYREYLARFYARQPDLAGQSYAEQYAALMHDAMERFDAYSVALAKLGYETDEIVADAEPMQKRWAHEHSVTYGEGTWMVDIVLAQIQAFRPEVLFLNTWIPEFGVAFVRRCRESCPSVKIVIGWVGEAHPGVAYFKEHDLVLSCAPDTVEYLRSQGIPSRQIHHAFDPRILERIEIPQEKSIDLGFIGHIYFGQQYHNARVQAFYAIARQVDLTIYGSMSNVAYRPRGIKRYLRRGYYDGLELLRRLKLETVARSLPRYDDWLEIRQRAPYVSFYAFLRDRVRPPVFGLDMYRTLAGFKICLNAHGPSAYASNMRLYETTGVGVCLLTDWKPNLPDLFELDSEVVAYRSAEEAVEKARYLLDHRTERKAIAAAGQRRTLRDHTYAQRAEELDAIITDYWRSGYKVS